MRSWLPFVLLTVFSWGTYIPTLHKGQVGLGGSGVHAFLMVGLAYLLVAILIPGTIIARAGSWDLFSATGMAFTFGAGVLGASARTLSSWPYLAGWPNTSARILSACPCSLPCISVGDP